MGITGKILHGESEMKVLAVIFAFVVLTSGSKIATKKDQLIKIEAETAQLVKIGVEKAQLITQAKSKQCGPDETDCPAGCCPMGPNWYCCPDMYCAPTAADCLFETKRVSLVNMAKSMQCGPDDTNCPSGCCPEGPNWFCCPDAFWPGCAPTADDCPYEAKRTSLVNLAKSNQCGSDQTSCPAGCCPQANWCCCPDMYCAPTAADCPSEAKKTALKNICD